LITHYSLDCMDNKRSVTPMSSPVFWTAMQQAVICNAKNEGKLEETVFQNVMALLMRRYEILEKKENVDG